MKIKKTQQPSNQDSNTNNSPNKGPSNTAVFHIQILIPGLWYQLTLI